MTRRDPEFGPGLLAPIWLLASIVWMAIVSHGAAQVRWDFEEGAAQTSLPDGWIKEVQYGDWVLQETSSTILGDDGVLSALFSPPPSFGALAAASGDVSVALGDSPDPQIQLDAISPEFEITDLGAAAVAFVMGTLLDDSNSGVQTDRIVLHLLEANPLAAPLFLWECGFVDAGVCNPNGSVGPISFQDKGVAAGGEYRLRVRVEDNDIDLNSFQHLELDDLTITGATLTSLPGDFNTDGVVDAADYTVWRDGLGGAYAASDYNVWRSHYGAGGAPTPSIRRTPEPVAAALVVASLGVLAVYSGSVRARRNPNERLPRS